MASKRTLKRRRQRKALERAIFIRQEQKRIQQTAEYRQRRKLLIDGLGFTEPLSVNEELHVGGLMLVETLNAAESIFLKHLRRS